MITALVIATILFLIIGIITMIIGYIYENITTTSAGIIIMNLACLFSGCAGNVAGAGCIKNAEIKLSPGETYECIAGPSENGDNICYAIVKTGNAEIYGLRFKELPPKKGVVSKTGDKIVFLPTVAQEITIKNPLVETPKK